MKSEGQRRSRKQERRVAEETGTQVVPASGALPWAKSDTRLPGKLRVECKTTRTSSFRMGTAVIDKIRFEALHGGMEEWAMQIEMHRPNGTPMRVAVIDWDEYLALRQKAGVNVEGEE